jgi:hypothetical protein
LTFVFRNLLFKVCTEKADLSKRREKELNSGALKKGGRRTKETGDLDNENVLTSGV